MAKIFISYRRDDSADYAGRLYDRLAGHFGRDQVFMDIDQIEPGEVFDNVIKEKLATVQAAVVLIGKRWLDIADANGQRRLDHPDDWVRLEITALLERDIRVIPVLVGGAAMPKLEQLPEYLVPLIRRQAHEIMSHARFHADTDKLIKVLEKIMNAPTPPQFEPPKIPKEPEKESFPLSAAIAGVIGIVLAAGVYFGGMSSEPTPFQPEADNRISEPTATEATHAETNPIAVKKPSVEQPQQAASEPITQPVTDLPKATVIEPDMVRIPPGKFLMGHDEIIWREGGPQHEVTIAYAFEIGKYEVTFDEYDAFAKATHRKLPDDRGWGRGKRPVINVTFDDVQAYVQWLAQQTGKKYRLPTEAEWEYVAQAGTQTTFWWGDLLGQNNANCSDCGSQWDDKQTAPVGSFKPNAFGLYDTAGNVAEWVEDCWHVNYQNAPMDGSAWLEKDGGDCDRRVLRGGSWRHNSLPYLTPTGRNMNFTDGANYLQGFRIARDIKRRGMARDL
ncbi:MAG: TIR domain-containing protein [Nitrosomonas sp. PRO4]|nr:TIR domain-containing protein [Nitrosomonas sp. PRO4]